MPARRWLATAAVASIGVMSVVLPPAASASAHVSPHARSGYTHYRNARFGFSLSRLRSFHATPPPEDGDGREWTTDHGRVSETAYGDNNIFGRTPKQDAHVDSERLHVTYKSVRGHVVIVSGYKHNGRTVVYQRDVVGKGSIDTLLWVYPASQLKRWSGPVTTTADGFHASGISTSH